MSDQLSQFSVRRTPQSEQADPREVKNNAGGYVFEIGELPRLHRFLTLGTEGGTFYVKAPKLTRDNAELVCRLATASDPRLTEAVRDISLSGRAPRQGPVLFSLAAAASLGSTEYRQSALDMLPDVARTGSHLLRFVSYIEGFRGWGHQLKRGVGRWYSGKEPSELAYQLMKYKNRYGWTHRDILRHQVLGHRGYGAGVTLAQRAVFEYVVKGKVLPELAEVPLMGATRAVHATRNVREWVRLIGENRSLTWEMLPSEALREAAVWEALFYSGTLPPGALITELPRLTRVGLLRPLTAVLGDVTKVITSPERLARARVHPVEVLIAAKVYAGGHSLDGKSTWKPVPQVTDALNDGFYAAFPAVEPARRRTMIATDTSGSMGWAIAGMPMTAGEYVGAMALVTARTEPEWGLYGFSYELKPLTISPRMRLDGMLREMRNAIGGSTDCSLPMAWALKNRLAVDTFQVYTDNETWYGDMHPSQALERYRQGMGKDARLQVVAVAPTEFSIADPDDPRQLDVSGFDSAVPRLLADHSRGEI